MAEGGADQQLLPRHNSGKTKPLETNRDLIPKGLKRLFNRRKTQQAHQDNSTSSRETVAGSRRFLEAETGQPFSDTMWRGVGRKDKVDIFTSAVAKEGVFGDTPDAVYSTPNPFFALWFGPKLDELTVTLKNPLVIRNDEEWAVITKAAGLSTNAPTTHEEVLLLRRTILTEGHDGVIVIVPLSKGSDTDAIQATFTENTVVKFGGVLTKPPVSLVSYEQK